jgi:hypothetical protein
MDPDLKKNMAELLELTRENNKMLHRMRRTQWWGTFFNVLYWLIIIGITAGAFYFLQPYFNRIKQFSSVLPNTAQIQAFFNQTPNNSH